MIASMSNDGGGLLCPWLARVAEGLCSLMGVGLLEVEADRVNKRVKTDRLTGQYVLTMDPLPIQVLK